MPSTRERILSALFDALASALTAETRRNFASPTKIPAAGLAILWDGDPGEPEVSMSPPAYHYEHVAQLEIYASGDARGASVDQTGIEVAAALAADRTLGGLCDWIEAQAPVAEDVAVAGGENIAVPVIPIRLIYATSDPLT